MNFYRKKKKTVTMQTFKPANLQTCKPCKQCELHANTANHANIANHANNLEGLGL